MALVTLPRQLTVDINGEPRVGALLSVYDAGTNNTRTVYTTKAFSVELMQPIQSTEGGIFPAIYINPAGGDFKLVIQDADGSVIYTEDNIPSQVGATDIDLVGIADESITTPIIASLRRTSAESSVGVVPVDYSYPPGHAYRYGKNTTPGTTDMTAALNTAANVCRQGKYTLKLPPAVLLVSSSLNFSGIRVEGDADYQNGGAQIRATGAQFDVITATGDSAFMNFGVHGGWDGTTAGQSGDCFSFKDASGDNFAYVINMFNVNISFAKKRFIYWESGGYGSLFRVLCNSAGLHGIELSGTAPVHVTTTIWIGGGSTFTSTPNGYGAKLTECVHVEFDDVIMEATKGIQVNGSNNRTLSFNRVYQEFNVGSTFIDFGSSAGIGVSIKKCTGIGLTITDPTNWIGVYLGGNAGLNECAVPFAGRILENTSTEGTTSTTGGVSVTAGQLDLAIGTWRVWGEFQIANSSGLSSTLGLGSKLTTNVADAGLANLTNNSFEIGADYSGDSGNSDRSRTFKIFHLTAAATVYLRGYINFAAGTAAYKGHLYAELVE